MKLRGLASCLLLLVYTESFADGPPAPTDPSHITIEEIFEHWRRRSESIHSFHFEWATKEWHARGSQSGFRKGPPLPATDVEFDLQVTLDVDESRVFHRRLGPDWLDAAKSFQPQLHMEYCDAEREISYFGPAEELDESIVKSPFATISRNDGYGYARSLMLLPMMITLRPIHAMMGRIDTTTKWRLLPFQAILDGRECLVVESDWKPISNDPLLNNHTTRIYVDAARGFIVPRYTITTHTQTVNQIDVEYVEQQDFGWLPSAWTYQHYSRMGDHELIRQDECAVTKWSVHGDIPMPDVAASFALGTRVSDALENRTWTVGRTELGPADSPPISVWVSRELWILAMPVLAFFLLWFLRRRLPVRVVRPAPPSTVVSGGDS